jgi:hypothetical protein
MKYILMMNTMRAGHGVPAWPQKDLQAHIAFMMQLNKDLRESGELVSAEGLCFRTRQSWSVRVRMAFRSQMVYSPNRRNFLPATGSSMSMTRNGHMPSPHERRRHRGRVGRH